MARPRIHNDATADALLEAAADVMRTDGSQALSVRRVAEAAGTSHRAVYALFGSMQGLLDALATHGYLDLAARVNALTPTDDAAADLVRTGVEGFRGFALAGPSLFRLSFEQISSEALRQPRVGEAAMASYRSLAVWVARVRADGGIHPARGDSDCIFAFHATCQGLAACELAAQPPPDGPGFWRRPLGPGDFTSAWTETLTSVVAGFRAPPPGSAPARA